MDCIGRKRNLIKGIRKLLVTKEKKLTKSVCETRMPQVVTKKNRDLSINVTVKVNYLNVI